VAVRSSEGLGGLLEGAKKAMVPGCASYFGADVAAEAGSPTFLAALLTA
jgi:hypothetical protein